MADTGHPMHVPATKAEVAFLAADVTLALRAVHLCLLAMKSGDIELVDEKISDLSKHTDEVWNVFKNITGR